MNAENFAEWQRQQGHQVVRTQSSYWCEAGPRVFQAFPYHWLISPSQQELDHLLQHNKILAIRYSTPIDAPEGKVSYHLVRSGAYNLEDLHGKTRKYVAQGLSNLTIKSVPFSMMAEQGWGLQHDTLQRQNRTNSMQQTEWVNLCVAAENIPGFEAWGAFAQGEMAAGLITVHIDDTYHLLYLMSHSQYLSLHVNHTLYYAVTNQFLAREGIKLVFSTLESLDAAQDIDTFKFRLAYQPKPVRQRVVFHPILRPFASKTARRLLNRLLKLNTNNPLLSKANGMLRFYVDGKLPINQQEIPACLGKTQFES